MLHKETGGLDRGAGAVQDGADFGAFTGSNIQLDIEWRQEIFGSLVLFPVSIAQFQDGLLACGNAADSIFPGLFRLVQVRESLPLELAQ